jgi:protein O-mannosyl-transferase
MIKSKQILIVYIFLAATTLLAFWQVGNNAFIDFDDNEYVTDNRFIQNGVTIQGLRWAFTTGYAANWHPLTWISHMADVQFFGLKPRGHHLTNLLFHIANVLLLFFVLNRMTKALWQSALVAALFALHPLRVESVAWVAERKDVLSAFFWMLTLIAYCYYTEKPRLKRYLAVIAFFALGLMAKPMLVTLPFVLLLLDYWPLERFRERNPVEPIRTETNIPASARRKKGKPVKQTPKITAEMEKPANHILQWALIRPLVLEKIPLFALSALSCAATYIAQKAGGAIAPIQCTFDVRLANAFVSYIVYIMKTIWPDKLAVFYPHPGVLPFWQVLGALLLLVAITLAVFLKGKKFPYLPVGWLWFVGTLVPVIGIVQVGGQALADRYTYIPLIGLFIVAAWGSREILNKRRHGKEILAVSSSLCLLCLLSLTWIQVGHWRDSDTLFDHVLNVTKNNYWLYNNRGFVSDTRGDHALAIEDFNRAIEINPGYAEAYNNRGVAYNAIGNPVRAIEDFNAAIKYKPAYAKAFNNRAVACMAIGNNTQAIDNFNIAIEIDPQYAEAYYNRAILYQNHGKYRQAIDDYDKAIKFDTFKKAEIFSNRGVAYASMGDHGKAIEDYGRAIEINPKHARAYFNRAVAYGEIGDQMKAIDDYSSAIAIIPEYAKAYFFRGTAYGILGNKTREIQDIRTAARFGYEDAIKYLNNHGIN